MKIKKLLYSKDINIINKLKILVISTVLPWDCYNDGSISNISEQIFSVRISLQFDSFFDNQSEFDLKNFTSTFLQINCFDANYIFFFFLYFELEV